MKRWCSFALAAAMLILAAVGCAGKETKPAPDTSTPNSTATAPEQPSAAAYKDSITIVTATDQNYMDGQMNSTNEKLLRTVYSSLVRKDPDTNEMVGDLAESWEVSEDGCTWIFHLRHGVKFHNGKDLTAADVKASYDRLLDAENPVRYTSTMNLIVSCEALDEYTVALSTADPSAALLPNLLHRANCILDADYIAQYGDRKSVV